MTNEYTDEENFYEELIDTIISYNELSQKELNKIKINLAKKHKKNGIVKNAEIISRAKKDKRKKLISVLNNKPVRELSGVTVVALFAKPHACPHGKCIYCPGGPDSPFGDTPQSYTGHEPAALRAIRNRYDPYLQIFNRLEHYVANGHNPDKLELIFMGGTFPSLDEQYRDEFVYYTYKAINDFAEEFITKKSDERVIDYEKFNEFFHVNEKFNSKEREEKTQKNIIELKNRNSPQKVDKEEMKKEIRKNETSLIRTIGLTIETKPDWAMEKHCLDMLEYGCTRLEIGVQTLNEECLKKTNRGHTLDETKRSFQISKDMCLKINAHMMVGLPASTLESDKKSLIDLFEKSDYRPDMIKIYPCMVVEGTPLYKMYEQNMFKPIDTHTAADIISDAYKYFPRYVRMMRVQRDIPTNISKDGIKNSNLREFVNEKIEEKNIQSKDIRAREIGFKQLQKKPVGEFSINVEKFKASKGTEYFIDVVDEYDTLIGFTRLRFPYQTSLIKEIDSDTALIRELHVYGQTIPVGSLAEEKKHQHKGWGKKLIQKAEEIAYKEGYKKMAIISGVGVREYYRKLGYSLKEPYMVKKLNISD